MVARESGMMPTPTAPYLQIFLTSDFLPKNFWSNFLPIFSWFHLLFSWLWMNLYDFCMFLGGFLMIFFPNLFSFSERMDASPIEILASYWGSWISSSHPACGACGACDRGGPRREFTRVNRPWAKLIVCSKTYSADLEIQWSHDDHTVSICFVFLCVKTCSLFSNPQEICSAVLSESGALYSLNKIVNAQLWPCSDAAIIRKTSCGRSSHYSDRSWQQNSTQKEVGLAVMW